MNWKTEWSKGTWRRRIYELDGHGISSSKVIGMLHTATKNLGPCMGCSKDVVKGQKYIQLLVIGAGPIHFDCHVDSECILGVHIRKARDLYGIPRTIVDCQKFGISTPQDLNTTPDSMEND